MVAHPLINTPTLPATILTMEAAVRTQRCHPQGALCQGTDMVDVALTSQIAPAPVLNLANLNNATTANSSPLPPTVNIPSPSLSISLNRCTLDLL